MTSYVNVQLASAQNDALNSPVYAKFSEVRTQAIVDDPSKYHLSVVRFAIDTSNIPLMYVPTTDKVSANPQTIFYISTKNRTSGATAQQPIVWIPQDQTAQIGTDGYYALTSVNYFLSLLNTAVVSSLVPLGLASANAPVFSYSADTQRISCAFISGFTGSFDLYLSPQLAGVLPNFSSVLTSIGYKLVVPSTGGTITQEVPNLQGFNALKTLTLISHTLPILAEGISAPTTAGLSYSGNSGGNATSLILTDFIPQTQVGYESTRQRWVFYTPSSEYRLIDLISTKPLLSIDLQVYWTDTYGVMRALTLPPNTTCSVKLMFRRKDYLLNVV